MSRIAAVKVFFVQRSDVHICVHIASCNDTLFRALYASFECRNGDGDDVSGNHCLSHMTTYSDEQKTAKRLVDLKANPQFAADTL